MTLNLVLLTELGKENNKKGQARNSFTEKFLVISRLPIPKGPV